MRLDGKVSVSVYVASMVPKVVFENRSCLYCILLFHIVGNHRVGYADNNKIYAVFPRPLSRPQMMKSLNHDLVAIYSWCLKYHMRLNHKKTKSMVLSLVLDLYSQLW